MEQVLTSSPADRATVIEVAGVDLEFRPVGLADSSPTAGQVLAAMGVHPQTDYVVLQWLPGMEVIEVHPETNIVVKGDVVPRLVVAKSDRTFRFFLNDHAIDWPADAVSEPVLRKLGSVPASDTVFHAREDEADHPIEAGETISLGDKGTEVFYSKKETWKLNVQGVPIESDAPEIAVREAIAKAGFDADAPWIIVLKTASGKRQVDLNYVIDLRQLGIEKLRLTPREINNGEVTAGFRRDFAVLPSDRAWLDEHGYDWITALEGGRRWLILRNVALPPGYNVGSATIAMEIPSAYPMAEIDMFYCHPHLARLDGQTIPQTQVNESIAGHIYQRWSRHRGQIAPWRAGKDSVVSHLTLIDGALNREVDQ